MKSGMTQVSAPTDLRTRLGEGTEITGEVRVLYKIKPEHTSTMG